MPIGQAQPPPSALASGVTRQLRFGPYGGSSGNYDYYFSGARYPNAAEANQAAELDLRNRQELAARPINPTTNLPGEGGPVFRPPTGGGVSELYGGGVPGGGLSGILGATGGQVGGGGGFAGSGPSGNVFVPSASTTSAITQPAYEQERLLRLRAELGENAFRARLGLLSNSTGGLSRVEGPGAATGEAAARAAAFARAKEQAAANAQSQLTSLRGILASQGLTGSSFEGTGIADIVGQAGGRIDDFTREQLIQDLNRAAQISDLRYQGDITQRGQDLNRNQALLGILAGGGLY